MTRQWADAPENNVAIPSVTAAGDEPVSLTVLREQWLQALVATAGASLHMKAGEDCVTLAVTIPLTPRTPVPGEGVPEAPEPVAPGTHVYARDVWMRFQIPSGLRRRFKAVAWRLRLKPKEVMRMLMEEFSDTGRVPGERAGRDGSSRAGRGSTMRG